MRSDYGLCEHLEQERIPQEYHFGAPEWMKSTLWPVSAFKPILLLVFLQSLHRESKYTRDTIHTCRVTPHNTVISNNGSPKTYSLEYTQSRSQDWFHGVYDPTFSKTPVHLNQDSDSEKTQSGPSEYRIVYVSQRRDRRRLLCN